eukprot:m.34865 g.34865  ORF g.34865 m.34865 type:complete len:142 (-) comp5697_c0_seq1:135-560(-)
MLMCAMNCSSTASLLWTSTPWAGLVCTGRCAGRLQQLCTNSESAHQLSSHPALQAQQGDAQVCRAILEQPNAQDLLAYGPSPYVQGELSEDGETPAQAARRNGHEPLARVLEEVHANKQLRNRAKTKGRHEVLDALFSALG